MFGKVLRTQLALRNLHSYNAVLLCLYTVCLCVLHTTLEPGGGASVINSSVSLVKKSKHPVSVAPSDPNYISKPALHTSNFLTKDLDMSLIIEQFQRERLSQYEESRDDNPGQDTQYSGEGMDVDTDHESTSSESTASESTSGESSQRRIDLEDHIACLCAAQIKKGERLCMIKAKNGSYFCHHKGHIAQRRELGLPVRRPSDATQTRRSMRRPNEQITRLGSELQTQKTKVARLAAEAETKDDLMAQWKSEAESKGLELGQMIAQRQSDMRTH